jgi:hypothetical protein
MYMKNAMQDWITLTREKIYELVWEKPMARVAAEHSISDVGLAKLCARHGIPTPPRGYWAQLEAGRAPPRPALPTSADRAPIRLRAAAPGQNAEKQDELSAAVTSERKPENRISVAERLQAPCPLVRHARDTLKGAADDQFGRLERPADCLDIRVTREQLSRALRVADALLKSFDSRGWAVAVHDGRTLVHVGGTPIAITIEERLETIEMPAKPNLGASYSFHYNRRETARKPGGDLLIGIREQTHLWSHSQKRNWRGSEKRALEDQLNDVIVGMLKLASVVRADLERRKQRELEEQEHERRLQAAHDEQRRLRAALTKEKSKVEQLLKQAARWRESQNLRRFIEQARERGGPPELGLDEHGQADWLQWALQQADRLDPFAPSPSSILDDADRIEHMCDKFQRYL